MTEDIVSRLRYATQSDIASAAQEGAKVIERLRRILHRYGDRVPMATSARPDWQQEIDDALGWVTDNPEQPMPDLEREAYEPLGRESELRPGFYEDDMP